MHIGLQFPTSEIGRDPGAIREFVQGVEALGFHHLTALEHVLGTASVRGQGGRAYSPELPIHEPLVTFGFIAAVTSRIELVTSILVLPQRQTVLVARQAAEVDVLSGGRLRLGIGVGWNRDEYEGMGADFRTRGQRVEEQVEVLRLLWTDPVVSYQGKWHTLHEAGITVLPAQRPIPIWMGGSNEHVLHRIGRLADGWMAGGEYDEARMETIRNAAREAGRDPGSIGVQARTSLTNSTPEQWRRDIELWRGKGATHLVAGTSGKGLSPNQHLQLAERYLRETKDLVSQPGNG